jgi:hypothetical protein
MTEDDAKMMMDGRIRSYGQIRSHRIRWGLLPSLLVIAVILGHCGQVFSADAPRLIGDLIQGAGAAPAGWRQVSQRHLDPAIAAETFVWAHPSGSPSELRLINRKRNLIQWERTLNLAEGWYYLSGEMRTEGLHPGLDLAFIAVQIPKNAFGLSWANEAAESDWKKGSLYLKVGKPGRKIDFTCKLEGHGAASFRSLSVTASSPPPAGVNRIDLDDYPVERAGQSSHPYAPPTGQPWSLIFTIILLMTVTICGWIGLDPRWK